MDLFDFINLPEARVSGCRDLTLIRGLLILLSAEYSVVISGACPGSLATWPWLRICVIYSCALRLYFQIYVMGQNAGPLFWSPYLLVPRQDASELRDCCIRTRWIRINSQTQIWEWLLRNGGFYGLWCETEL